MTDQERMIAEIVQSNETLRTQLWILTSVISLMFIVVSGLINGAWKEFKTMVLNQENRLQVAEKNIVGITRDIENLKG
jgi:ABC-type lipoprotein release transport system permease subunit